MPHRTTSYPAGVAAVLGLVAIMACDDDTDDNQFREDVISCEEAVARLEECCPGLSAKSVACKYYYHRDVGCDSTTVTRTDPDIDLQASRCIRDATCEEVVQQDLCSLAAPADGGRRPVCR